jgi:hypothetical protein
MSTDNIDKLYEIYNLLSSSADKSKVSQLIDA